MTPVPMSSAGKLMSFADAVRAIHRGRVLYVAGDESILARLPAGQWIGGTIPYFMGANGGLCTREQVFVTELPATCGEPEFCRYDAGTIPQVCVESPEVGFTLLIVPAFSAIHEQFAREAPGYQDMYLKPLVGWVAGVHLDDLGKVTAKVAFGPTGELDDQTAVAVHVPIIKGHSPSLQILNLFEPGTGAVIRFPLGGFSAADVEVDGKAENFSRWLKRMQIDTRLPLVADYSGAMINVSIREVEEAGGLTHFYAPVFPELEYRIAAPVPSYAEAFRALQTPPAGSLTFCCNCILNYLYGELEGQRIDPMHGPMTFGEIAYQLVNQTLVFLETEE